MKIHTSAAEPILRREVHKRKDKAAWHCLQFHFSKLQPLTYQRNTNILINAFVDVLGTLEGEIFYCADKDIFLLAKGLTKKDFERIILHIRSLFIDDPLASNSENLFAIGGAKKGKENFCTYFNLQVNYEQLLSLCDEKIEIMENIEKEKQKAPEGPSIDSIPVNMEMLESALEQRERRRKLYIMIVEDQPFSRQLLVDVIRQVMDGKQLVYDVVVEAGGARVLDTYSTYAPNIVFMDIGLPVFSGHQFLGKIMSLDPEAFIVMLTANTYEEDVKKAAYLGAKGFIAKPFTKIKLEHYLNAYTANRKRH